jgi:hypothetical protein
MQRRLTSHKRSRRSATRISPVPTTKAGTGGASAKIRPLPRRDICDEFQLPGSGAAHQDIARLATGPPALAVTLDRADRLVVMAIATEIDRLDPQQQGKPDFKFFRRTSAELCAAILSRVNRASPCCGSTSRGLTMIA